MDPFIPMWDPAQVAFDLVDDLTTDPVVTVTVSTPAGVLKLMAEPERVGRTLSCTACTYRTSRRTWSVPRT